MEYHDRKRDLLIIMPAFNEEGSIAKVLNDLLDMDICEIADILILDDASTDNTGDIVRSYGFVKITHAYNLGYGSGLQTGYKYAVRHGYQHVIQMDSDGQHDVCNIPAIYEELTRADDDGYYPDIVVGSRFLEGSKCFKISHRKRFAMRVFSGVIKASTGQVITDPTTGLQGLSRRAFLYYSRYNCFNSKYPDANMLIQMILLGFRVKEIPSVMHDRHAGTSMHAGMIEPMIYMFHMGLSILSVLFRIKIWKIDVGMNDDDEF